MNKRYLVISFGYFGFGNTVEEAQKQHKKVGGKLRSYHRIYEFSSDNEFARIPANFNGKGDDLPDEGAYCWVSEYGVTCWKGCERRLLQEINKPAAREKKK